MGVINGLNHRKRGIGHQRDGLILRSSNQTARRLLAFLPSIDQLHRGVLSLLLVVA